MSWLEILKIVDDEGKNLVISDVDAFTTILRARLVELRNYERGRKTNIVVKETYLGADRLKLVVSIKPKSEKLRKREYIEITLKEDDTGDYYFERVEGPNIFLFRHSVSDEYALMDMIISAVKKLVMQ